MEAIDRIDEALVGSNNVNMKWYESLREKWHGRLTNFEPPTPPPDLPPQFQTDEEMREKGAVVLELFRQRKQFMGYGR